MILFEVTENLQYRPCLFHSGFKKSVEFAEICRIRWWLIFLKTGTVHTKFGTIQIKIGIVHPKFGEKNQNQT
jgi:hypothetical protein